jgi:hypothetical protein
MKLNLIIKTRDTLEKEGIYIYPEMNRTAKQIVDLIKNIDFTKDVIIYTLNDFVVKQLNIELLKGKYSYKDIKLKFEADDTVKKNKDGIDCKSMDVVINEINKEHEKLYYYGSDIFEKD